MTPRRGQLYLYKKLDSEYEFEGIYLVIDVYSAVVVCLSDMGKRVTWHKSWFDKTRLIAGTGGAMILFSDFKADEE